MFGKKVIDYDTLDPNNSDDRAVIGSMKREARVMNHLRRYGEITQDDARILYSAGRLSAIINTVRKRDGYDAILTEMVEGTNQFGQKYHYAKYVYNSEAYNA